MQILHHLYHRPEHLWTLVPSHPATNPPWSTVFHKIFQTDVANICKGTFKWWNLVWSGNTGESVDHKPQREEFFSYYLLYLMPHTTWHIVGIYQSVGRMGDYLFFMLELREN